MPRKTRRLTKSWIALGAALAALGAGGAVSAIGASATVQQTVPLPPVQGSVTLCVLTEDPAQCKTTPEPLAQGATLTVKAFGNRETTTEPSLSVVPATCPAGQSGTAIKVTTGGSQTDLVVEVSGTGATSLAPTKLVDQHNTGTSQTVPVVSACVKPPKVG